MPSLTGLKGALYMAESEATTPTAGYFMFNELQPLPADPILGLIARYQQDPRPDKIDLGGGVYRNALGKTPVLSCVKQAEHRLLEQEQTKAYIGPLGNPDFNALMTELVLGADHPRKADLALVQAPGGCGALRVAAEMIKTGNPSATIWVSNPTWGNHMPLLGNAGVNLKEYPYYDFKSHTVNFEATISKLQEVPKGDLVLLHGCCHNPTGADFTEAQWRILADLAEERGFVPFIDMAYQGFGASIEQDAFGVRHLCERLPEVVLAVSSSKNFGLYRDRIGAVGILSAAKPALQSHIATIVRGIYSMPPNHGAAIVAEILGHDELRDLWVQEVSEMRERIQSMRTALVSGLNAEGAGGRFDHIAQQRGMFSFMGLSEAQVQQLSDRYGIYMVGTSRISIAGLNPENLGTCCKAICEVTHQSG